MWHNPYTAISFSHRFGAVLEEIVLEEPGDADEHVEVDAGAFEHLVDVAALTVNSAGEPGYRAALCFQLRLYHSAYVYVAHIDAVSCRA